GRDAEPWPVAGGSPAIRGASLSSWPFPSSLPRLLPAAQEHGAHDLVLALERVEHHPAPAARDEEQGARRRACAGPGARSWKTRRGAHPHDIAPGQAARLPAEAFEKGVPVLEPLLAQSEAIRHGGDEVGESEKSEQRGDE